VGGSIELEVAGVAPNPCNQAKVFDPAYVSTDVLRQINRPNSEVADPDGRA